MKVMIIDDEYDIGYILKIELELNGHECMTFETASAAQKYLAAGNTTDVIICDFQMPRMNGLQFFQWLKTTTYRGPFYILTGEPTMDTKALLDQGITEVYFKPHDLNKIIQVIK